ncbi:MAG: PfkB family carbohydrate kinase [Akkermansia sp.]
MKNCMLIYGTIAIDTLRTPHGDAQSVLGGSGVYAALSARLINPNQVLLGVVGDDFPPAYSEALEDKGVSMAHVCRMAGETFQWTGQYEDDMNNRTTISTTEGVQDIWQPRIPEELRDCSVMLSCNVRPDLQWQILEQGSPDALLIVDFMKSWLIREPAYVAAILAKSDIALMNEEEAAYFAQCEGLEQQAGKILAAGARYAIIKLGSKGSVLFHQNAGGLQRFDCPAYPVTDATDPTGAGDSFMGVLGAYLCQQHAQRGGDAKVVLWTDLCEGMRLASRIAAIVCESFGTNSIFKVREAPFPTPQEATR